MKNLKTYLFATLIGFSSFLSAQSVSVTSAMILSAPLNVVENNGTGFGSFTFAESSSVSVNPIVDGLPNVTIDVVLHHVNLSNFDVSMISGSLLDYFQVTYNLATNTILFEQDQIIPGDWYGSVTFPITVTQNSSQEVANNGFEAVLLARDLNTNYDGSASVFTYTEFSETAANEDLIINNLTIYPIPTNNILNIDNTEIGDLNIKVYDSKGSLVLENTLRNQKNTINLENLSRGIYYLKIQDLTKETYENAKFILK